MMEPQSMLLPEPTCSHPESVTQDTPHELSLGIGCMHEDELTLQEFHPKLVKLVASMAQDRDLEKLKELGGLEGLASHLHTDLRHGLQIGCNPESQSEDINILAHRRCIFGQNAYPQNKGTRLWIFLLEACQDTTLNIPMLCAALSLGFGVMSDGIKEGWYAGFFIAVSILLVIVVAGVSNYRQCKQFQRLSEERDNIQVKVVRGSRLITLSLIDIVVGDIVQLSVGDHVPADGVVVQGHSLLIDESSLTGESEYYIPDPDQEQAFLWSGSKIKDGYGSMLITSVRTNTEWGRMMALLSNDTDAEETPLQARLRKAMTLVGKVGLSVALLVLVILIIFYFTGHSSTSGDAKIQAGRTSATEVMDAVVHIFSIAVNIVVVAVPQGLPLAVTLTLAYSMRNMLKDVALVRRLAACETMGSATTVICSNKTGTLTMNQMAVVRSWVAGKVITSEEPQGAELRHMLPDNSRCLLFQAIAQNSTGSVSMLQASNELSLESEYHVVGSPTEKALLWWGLKAGMDFQASRSESSILQVDTFNSAKKRAGVAVQASDKQIIVHWKGAAENILSMCNKWVDTEPEMNARGMSERVMSNEKRQELQALIESMASCSLRCIALAYTKVVPLESTVVGDIGCSWSLPDSGLTFLAVVGMKDPCRPEVRPAVSALRAAGVTVRMVTEDHLSTAEAIASECGILDMAGAQDLQQFMAVDGATLRGWTEQERKQNLPRVALVARALPSDKLLLVETLKSMGEVVAVTGDRTDDAPALQKADIRISILGIQGTEFAKESSDIIILDSNFASLVKVVRWGRCVNFNIRKFLQFQLTLNMAALVVNLAAAVSSAGEDVPMTIVNVLWLHLIMTTAGAVAFATEPPTDELMRKPPVGKKEPLITYSMWRNLAAQAISGLAVLLALPISRGVQLLRLSQEKDADSINRMLIFNTYLFYLQHLNTMNAREPYS